MLLASISSMREGLARPCQRVRMVNYTMGKHVQCFEVNDASIFFYIINRQTQLHEGTLPFRAEYPFLRGNSLDCSSKK